MYTYITYYVAQQKPCQDGMKSSHGLILSCCDTLSVTHGFRSGPTILYFSCHYWFSSYQSVKVSQGYENIQ